MRVNMAFVTETLGVYCIIRMKGAEKRNHLPRKEISNV
jgi:hypothetical protein